MPALCVKALFADGRAREQAVRLLAESGSLAALPVLGLRAADWVPQVREAAREAIRRQLSDDVDGAALTAVAPMALHLARRSHGRWLAEQTTERLADPSYERVANRLLTSPNLGLRRAAYQALSNSEALGLERAVHSALHDRDIVIRGRCAEYAARLAVDAASSPLMRQLLASTTPLVRAVALGALNKLGERDTIEAMLADRSALVRGTARFYLKPHGVDFAGMYRQLLGSGPDTVTPGAVAGLAEVGGAEDTGVILTLLSHSRVKVRVEAIRALQAVASSIDTDAMLALIEENWSPAVTRQATTTLLARGAGVDADRLLAPGRQRHAAVRPRGRGCRRGLKRSTGRLAAADLPEADRKDGRTLGRPSTVCRPAPAGGNRATAPIHPRHAPRRGLRHLHRVRPSLDSRTRSILSAASDAGEGVGAGALVATAIARTAVDQREVVVARRPQRSRAAVQQRGAKPLDGA